MEKPTMTENANCPAPALEPGAVLHGFKILRVRPLDALRLTAYEMEHRKTGARVLHLHSFEKENLFAVGFRTPPYDSTGVPHILEHSVLAGSEKYPLKDVFNELLRSTMQTFINAFTYPDKTIYPVASQIKADFYNLARVYTNLVLKPRLLKETFYQEGHHYEFIPPDDATGDLTISGIVYNEMKGAYSSPDSLMYKGLQENIYPQTVYSFDSGGDPEIIATLTYEQFVEFHRKYYSPGNASFFIYGDIPTVEHLKFLQEMLKGFVATEVRSEIASQERLSAPRTIRGTFPLGREESLQKKATVNMAWLMSENVDYETTLLLEMTSALLTGSAASPLRKSLIDSGLGEDLSPVSGMETELKQLMFCVGLRGTEAASAGKIEQLILSTLEEIAQKGFAPELIEGVLHQVEFHGKEINRGSYPYGIALMGKVYRTWLYGGDPLIGLDFPAVIATIRENIAARPELFQNLIRQWFLNNTHRVLQIMEPDYDFAAKKEKAFNEKMARIKAGLRETELQQILTAARELKKYQSDPDLPSAAKTIPKIKVSDIPREVEKIPSQNVMLDGICAYEHEIFTNDVLYLNFAFDISHVPEYLQIYLPLLGKLTCGMGAAGLTYEEMAKLIALKTGGLGYDLACGNTADAAQSWQKMIFSVKSLYRNVPEALQITADLLTAGDLACEARLRDLVAERKNALHAAVVPSGHIFAKRAAGAALTLPAYRDEQWHGRTQLRFIYQTAAQLDGDIKMLTEKMRDLRQAVFNRNNLIINITADSSGLTLAEKEMAAFTDKLPEGGIKSVSSFSVPKRIAAGIALPSQVNYCARTLPAPAYADKATAMLLVASRYLSNGYLYKTIRVQGGAYGGMSLYDPTLGLFSFLSYRDPHIAQTINAFRKAESIIAQSKISREEINKAITGTIAMLDKPTDPAGRGVTAMMREFAKVTDEMRQQVRDRILKASAAQLKEATRQYFAQAGDRAACAVYGTAEKINEANEQLAEKLTLESLLDT